MTVPVRNPGLFAPPVGALPLARPTSPRLVSLRRQPSSGTARRPPEHRRTMDRPEPGGDHDPRTWPWEPREPAPRSAAVRPCKRRWAVGSSPAPHPARRIVPAARPQSTPPEWGPRAPATPERAQLKGRRPHGQARGRSFQRDCATPVRHAPSPPPTPRFPSSRSSDTRSRPPPLALACQQVQIIAADHLPGRWRRHASLVAPL